MQLSHCVEILSLSDLLAVRDTYFALEKNSKVRSIFDFLGAFCVDWIVALRRASIIRRYSIRALELETFLSTYCSLPQLLVSSDFSKINGEEQKAKHIFWKICLGYY